MKTLSEHYRVSIAGLLKLHALFRAGQEDGEEPDAVRDSLSAPWYAMSGEEQLRVRFLSEDLYSIGHPHQPETINPQAFDKLARAIALREAGQPDKALDLIRRWGKHMEPYMLAYFRATVWKSIGEDAVAGAFQEEFERLKPVGKQVEETPDANQA